MAESIRSQTLSGVKWTALESFSTQIIGFCMGVVIARMLSPSDYGVIGVLSVFITFSGVFINSGFTTALIRETDMSDEDCSTVFYFNIVVSIICYIILFFCSSLIAQFFNIPILQDIVKVYCLSLIIGAFESVQITRLTKRLNFKALAKVNVITSITSGIIGVTLAYFGWGVWALVWQSVLNGLLHVILIWVVANWIPGLVFSKSSFKKLFAFGSKLLAGGLIHQVYNQLTPIIIGRFYTAADLGQYTRGTSYATLPANTIFGVLQKVTFPILAQIQNDRERLINVYRKYIKSTSMCIMFVLILLAALAKPIVLIMLTDKWAGCVIFLQIYVFSVCFDHIQQLNINLLNVVGRSDLVLKMEVYKKTISTAILLASIPFGVIGICISKVIYEQIALIFNTYYSGKLFGLGYLKQMNDFMPYFILSVLCCLPAYVLTFTDMHYLLVVVIGAFVSAILFVGIMLLKKDSEFTDFILPFILKLKQLLIKNNY